MNVVIKVSIGSYILSSYRKKQQYTYLGVKSGSRLLVYRNAGASVLRACACVTIYSSALRFVLMYVKSNKFLIQKFFTKFLSKGKTLLFQYLVCPKFFLYIIFLYIWSNYNFHRQIFHRLYSNKNTRYYKFIIIFIAF